MTDAEALTESEWVTAVKAVTAAFIAKAITFEDAVEQLRPLMRLIPKAYGDGKRSITKRYPDLGMDALYKEMFKRGMLRPAYFV